ncbi:MAG: hypothetical protein ACI4BD_02555 [Paludibacteraceae bacterium]
MKKLFSCVAAVLFAVSVSAAVDVLTADMLPATSTQTYVEFTGVTATSDAVYAGQTANKNGAIQMRSKNSNSGIVSTTSGGKVLTVSVEWDSETTSKRTVDIYGSNTPYSSAADLYNNSARGTKLGSIALEDETATITVEGDYYYVGLRSNDGALYLKSISIEWDGSDVPEPEEPEEPVEPAVIDTLTCAAAAEKALAGVTDSAVVIGYVTEIASAWTEKNGYLSFWMADSVDGGRVFEAYRAVCATAEDAPGVGDKVAVKGQLTKYNSTPEFAAGCTFIILEHNAVEPEEKGEVTIAEFIELKDRINIYTLTGTVSNIAKDKNDTTQYSVYGNFDLTDETGTIYIYGLLTAEGESKKFLEMGIEEGDVITIKGSYNEYNGTPQVVDATFVSKSSGETALETVRTAESAEKRIVDGQLVIIRNGVMYNAAGTRME